MLTIVIPETELYDESTNTFVPVKRTELQLEHSLISLSKWEAKWHKAFLSKKNENKTYEEMLDYIKAMTVNKVDAVVYRALTKKNITDIHNYINDPMTAVYFPESQNQGPSRDTPTSELIYYWMIALNIPFECQKWHLNRLMALIKVCEMKNEEQNPNKKGKRPKTSASDRRALNEARLKKYNTTG